MLSQRSATYPQLSSVELDQVIHTQKTAVLTFNWPSSWGRAVDRSDFFVLICTRRANALRTLASDVRDAAIKDATAPLGG